MPYSQLGGLWFADQEAMRSQLETIKDITGRAIVDMSLTTSTGTKLTKAQKLANLIIDINRKASQ